MKPSNRITYRFENKDHKLPARKPELSEYTTGGQAVKNNVVPLYEASHAKTVEESLHHALEEDISELERLIREAGQSGEAVRPHAFERRSGGGGAKPAAIGGGAGAIGDDRPATTGSEAVAIGGAKDEQGLHEAEEPLSGPWSQWGAVGGLKEGRTAGVAATGGYPGWAGDPPYTRRTASPSWTHVFLSVAGALLTGALFGYLILVLFTGAELWPSSGSGQEQTEIGNNAVGGTGTEGAGSGAGPGDPGAAPGASGGEGGRSDGGNQATGQAPPDAAPNVPTVSLSGPAVTYTLLQFGVFTQTDSRDAALAQLRDQGLPAVSLKGDNDYRVFAGIATDDAKADVLVGQLPELLLYKKQMPVAAPAAMPFGGTAEEAEAYFARTNELAAAWSDLIAAQLEQPSLSPLGTAAAAAWQEKHKLWAESAGAMEKGLTDQAAQAYFEPLSQAIDAAAASMLQYDKEPSKAHLWKAQEAVLRAVLTQKEWFESMSAL